MKKIGIITAVMLGISFAACKKEAPNQTAGQVLNNGKWRVSYYWDKDHDETADFNGYEFTFNNGTLTATNGTNTVTGTYSEGTDDGVSKFNIHINSGTGPFDELDDDWDVIEKSATLIKLKEESGSGGTEYLNFSKI